MYANRREIREERKIKKRKDRGNRKNNHKRRETYGCRHNNIDDEVTFEAAVYSILEKQKKDVSFKRT